MTRLTLRMATPSTAKLLLLLTTAIDTETPRAGDVHLGGHVLPGWRPSKVISLPWIWNCMKPENWLRINLSGDWCLCIALRTRSGACYYWIAVIIIITTLLQCKVPVKCKAESVSWHAISILAPGYISQLSLSLLGNWKLSCITIRPLSSPPM